MRHLLLALLAFLSLSAYAQECCIQVRQKMDSECHNDEKRRYPQIDEIKVFDEKETYTSWKADGPLIK